MTDRQTIFLVGPAQRQYAHKCIDAAPDDFVCILKQKTRTLAQNAKFHAMCTDVSEQCKFLGKSRTIKQWKLIFISGHAVATNQEAECVPGIEGEFLNLRESSADMGVRRLSSVIEYMLAWGANNNVKWTEPNRGEEMMNRRYG
jgi:hypothetical protein